MSNQISYESLLEKYYEDNILLETLVGINDAILGDNALYLENIFGFNPKSPLLFTEFYFWALKKFAGKNCRSKPSRWPTPSDLRSYCC